MKPKCLPREEMLESLSAWSLACPEVRGLALVGSGARSARSDHPADQWSDIDLVLVTSHPETYLETLDWLHPIAEPWITTVERDGQGNLVERRVLFRNGVDVDFIIVSNGRLQMLQEEPLSSILPRGLRILCDKDQVFLRAQNQPSPKKPVHPPSAAEFSELVNDFWFHTVWTAKKIKRGELWTAKSCCDVYLKRLLLTMIEWHAHALEGWERETWYNGRFIESWAGETVVSRLGDIFAHYAEEDIKRALLCTLQMFDLAGRETAARLGYPYPEEESQGITKWLAALLSEKAEP